MEGFNVEKGKEKATDDALFLERLEMLYEQSLADLRAFAEREGRPYAEVKRHVAELHSKSLFHHSGQGTSTTNRTELIRSILLDVSQQLESLETLAGLQSFFLVVDPNNLADEGFLGGTLLGREFWRGHRGCGSAGAQAFKARCLRSAQPHQNYAQVTHVPVDPALLSVTPPPAAVGNKGSARELKTELYAAMRDALRATSGIRNAEMKWTSHSKLNAYGVRIEGWPDYVPRQNPSTLSVAHNKLLLEMLYNGQITFVRLDGAPVPRDTREAGAASTHGEEEAIFEDSIDYSWACEVNESASQATQSTGGTNCGVLSASPPSGDVDRQLVVGSPGRHGLPAEQAGSTAPKKRRVDEA